MKSQLLQSCQGCAPSIYKPHPSLPKGGRNTSTLISTLHMRKTKRIRHIVYNRFVPSPLRKPREELLGGTPAPWGGFGEGPLLAAVFVPAKAGLFERPLAAFFTAAAAGVMPRMTVGMAETTRRKTRFPTVGTAIHAKAKPTAPPRLFVFMSSPYRRNKWRMRHATRPF